MTDLVERVAMAICLAHGAGCEAVSRGAPNDELWEGDARAAIAVVLEEAAIKLESDFQDFIGVAPSAAAAAIRALNPKER